MTDSFFPFGSNSSLSKSVLSGIDYDKFDLGKQIDFSGPEKRKRGSGIFEAFTKSLERKEDKDDTFKRAKALNLANTFRDGSFKVSDDTTVMPGYMDPGFEYTIPGRKGFGDIIGSGAGFLIGNAIMPGVGGKYGAALGGNIGSRF